MLKNSHGEGLDEIDKELLRILQEDAHLTNVEIARKINLSPPATHARIRSLEQRGYIRQYTVLVNREMVGYDLVCFMLISLQVHQYEMIEKFRAAVRKLPEVLECHHLTGDYDYLLKVAFRTHKDVERFVVDRLMPIPGMARIHTSLVLTEVKYSTALPIE
ncbi:Lrp/AsnC family transcriptional regulator [Ktedonosporobacter rubrisoli]|uniref:Lrp/AsnC family transcriptional regulator n=1 Tax=Ktedonosporobacter rubrisoli TaxID=2509675 RepID=A0A4P6JWJ6_KTERU|nr:Lrp/AsnC family transcriptional regulator [Ktedonosporobacter rubrisoli]QBD80069.1 Lrp/AsnC family transcriptional regulator [Ktedonosporobacter rubrisoli]